MVKGRVNARIAPAARHSGWARSGPRRVMRLLIRDERRTGRRPERAPPRAPACIAPSPLFCRAFSAASSISAMTSGRLMVTTYGIGLSIFMSTTTQVPTPHATLEVNLCSGRAIDPASLAPDLSG